MWRSRARNLQVLGASPRGAPEHGKTLSNYEMRARKHTSYKGPQARGYHLFHKKSSSARFTSSLAMAMLDVAAGVGALRKCKVVP